MKKFTKLFLAFTLILTSFIIVGCKKDEEPKGGGNPIDTPAVEIDVKTVYVAPNIKSAASGTENDPTTIADAIANAKPGQTIKLLGRTTTSKKEYTYDNLKYNNIVIPKTTNGTAQYPITLDGNGCTINYKGMPESDSNYGIKLAGSYWHIKDLNISYAGDNGMLVGGNYNLIENCEFSFCKDTGLQISRAGGDSDQPTIDSWPSNNIIKNCTSHDNMDTKCEDADGFAAKLTVGYGNVFDGCVSYANIDDGWDLYAKVTQGNIGAVYLYNCISYRNGMLSDGFTNLNADGNGFKLGGEKMDGEVYVENCLAFNNLAHGFTDNSNPGIISIKNCTSFDNGIRISTKAIENIKMARAISDRPSPSFNYYEGILSFYSENFKNVSIDSEGEKIENGTPNCVGDEFKGIGLNSIFVSPRDGVSTVKFGSVNSIDSKSASLSGIDCDFATTLGKEKNAIDTVFKDEWTTVNAQSKTQIGRLHELWRNNDGSLNLGGFANSGSTVYGCDLNKASQNLYPTKEFMVAGENETMSQEKVRMAYDSLSIPGNQKYVLNVKALNLPTEIAGCQINWESSNNVCTINNNVASIINDKDKDNSFTLTATITYGKSTLTKTFECNRIKFVPLIGDVANYSFEYTQKQNGELEEATNDETKLKVYDRNTEEQLVLNTDYTISKEIKFVATGTTNEVVVDSVDSNIPGVYTVSWTIRSIANSSSYEIMKQVVTIVGIEDPLEIYKESISGIANGNVDIVATTTWKEGEIYIAVVNGIYNTSTEVTTPEWIPTKEQIMSGDTDGIHAYVDRKTITLDSFSLNTTLQNIGDACVIYMVTKSYNNVISDVNEYIRAKKLVSTADELYRALKLGGLTIKLANDIDCEGYQWDPIIFNSGVLDGGGYAIKNLTNSCGMFLEVNDSTIINVTLENFTINAGSGMAGAIAGTTYNNVNSGLDGYVKSEFPGKVTVKNVILKDSNIKGGDGTAGLFGHTGFGDVTIDSVIVTNTTVRSDTRYAGGIIGWADDRDSTKTNVSNVYVDSTVNIICGGSGYAGGIVARYKNQAMGEFNISKCIFAGSIKDLAGQQVDTKYIGGILGGTSDHGTIGVDCNRTYITDCAVNTVVDISANSDSSSGSVGGRSCGDLYVTMTNTYSFGPETNYLGKGGTESIDNANIKSVDLSSFTGAYLIEKLQLDTNIWEADATNVLKFK